MTLAINESTKMPEAGRVLFDEVVARKRETLRQALTRGKMCGAVSDADIEMAALMIPWMAMGVALGKAVTSMILNGIGGICAEEPETP